MLWKGKHHDHINLFGSGGTDASHTAKIYRNKFKVVVTSRTTFAGVPRVITDVAGNVHMQGGACIVCGDNGGGWIDVYENKCEDASQYFIQLVNEDGAHDT